MNAPTMQKAPKSRAQSTPAARPSSALATANRGAAPNPAGGA